MEVVHGAGFFSKAFFSMSTQQKNCLEKEEYIFTLHTWLLDRGKVSVAPCSAPVLHLVLRETPMDKMTLGPLIGVNSHCYITCVKNIYGPMIYTDPYVMLLMRANLLRGQVGGGWALEIETFWTLWNGIEPLGVCHLGICIPGSASIKSKR
jgi:hypothetical protein